MRSKPVQWLLVTVLLFTCSAPGWAKPRLVGEEFQVNQNKESHQLRPVVAFGASGNSLVVWENDLYGIRGRFYDRTGALTGEISLVPNKNLSGIPARGEVLARKDPAVVTLPNGEFVLFWTEEKNYQVLDHFYINEKLLDQDVLGQRFDAAGKPLGERFVVNSTTAGFQRRPKATLETSGIFVVWETSLDGRSSISVQGRLLTRRGRPVSDETRIDAGTAPEVLNTAVAANAAGDVLVAWESQDADGPGIAARLYDRTGTATGAEFIVNANPLGRQRRPAVVADHKGDFLVTWQGFLQGVSHGIYGQFVSPAGDRVGAELQLGKGVGEVSVAPAVALLPSGDFVVAWIEWKGTLPLAVFAVGVDSHGRVLGDEVVVSQDRVYQQYHISIAASASGDVLTTWEGRISRERSIAARRLLAD